MSYNITTTITDSERLVPQLYTINLTTDETELFDSILSGQNYSQTNFNYERTFNNSDVIRKQVIDLLENRNQAYLQLLALATNGIILFHAFRGERDHSGLFWERIKNPSTSLTFTVDELVNLEDQLQFDLSVVDLNDARLPIGQYPAKTLRNIINLVATVRGEYKTDPSLQNVSFSIG